LSPGFNLVKEAQIGVGATLRLGLRLRPPWLFLKPSLSVCRTLLLLVGWELLRKQRVSPRLLLVVVVLVQPVVVLLSVLVEPVVVLLSVLVELVVRLLSVLVELLLVVLVESLLLSVVVLRELLAVVVLLTIILLAIILLAVVLLAVVLLAVVLLAVVLILFTVTEGPNVDVPRKTWDILSAAVASDRLWHSTIRHCVLVQDGLRRSVSQSASRARAAVATVAEISSVALTSRVGRPSSISCANGINISPSWAVKPASAIEKSSGTITGDARAKSGNLLLHSGFVLNTPRDVRPRSVVLTKGDIVSASLTDHLAGLSGKRLRAISREAGACCKSRGTCSQGRYQDETFGARHAWFGQARAQL